MKKFKMITLPFYPTKEQKDLAWNIIGSCFYAANSYISHTNYMHSKGEYRLSYKKFHKYYNKCKNYTYDKINSITDEWEKEFALKLKERTCYRDSKAVKEALKQVSQSYERVYNENIKLKEGDKVHKVHYRNYKKYKRASFYFARDNCTIKLVGKHYINIPLLGVIKVLHINRFINIIPHISSGQIIIDHGKWFVSFRYKDYNIYKITHKKFGIGIDYGVKNLIVMAKTSTAQKKAKYYDTFKGFLEDPKYIKMNNRYKALQKAINHKQEINYWRLINDYLDTHGKEPDDTEKNRIKSLSYKSNRINKLYRKAHKQLSHISNYRDDYFKKRAHDIVVNKAPSFIKIEDLDVSEMISNDNLNHLDNGREYINHKSHKKILEVSPYKFRMYLLTKCNDYGTLLLLVDKYFPSSQTCSKCGYVRKGKERLMLHDREYICPICGYTEDRDINAAMNIALTRQFKIISA